MKTLSETDSKPSALKSLFFGMGAAGTAIMIVVGILAFFAFVSR